MKKTTRQLYYFRTCLLAQLLGTESPAPNLISYQLAPTNLLGSRPQWQLQALGVLRPHMTAAFFSFQCMAVKASALPCISLSLSWDPEVPPVPFVQQLAPDLLY